MFIPTESWTTDTLLLEPRDHSDVTSSGCPDVVEEEVESSTRLCIHLEPEWMVNTPRLSPATSIVTRSAVLRFALLTLLDHSRVLVVFNSG